jgi:hypothetical protein
MDSKDEDAGLDNLLQAIRNPETKKAIHEKLPFDFMHIYFASIIRNKNLAVIL